MTLRLLQRGADAVRDEPATSRCEELVARLFEEAREDVYRYLLLVGLPPAHAQDATQEVFLRLYVVLRRGERIENPRAWIFRVAHNHASTVRRRESSVIALEPALEAVLPDSQEDPEQKLIGREQRARLQRAVSGLSRQQQLCLYLRAEGFRYREIAKILDIGDSTVSEFLRRAIGRLRKEMHA